MRTSSPLEELPSELLLHLLSFLSLSSLLELSLTSRSFYSLIESTVLPHFALHRLNYSPSTLKHLHNNTRKGKPWSWGKKASWSTKIEQKWKDWDFTGMSFGNWDRSMPVIKLWEIETGVQGVLIARGRGLEWWVAIDQRGTMINCQILVKGYEEEERGYRSRNGYGYGNGRKKGALDDITALTEGGKAGEIIVSRLSGVIQLLKVKSLGRGRGRPIVLEETARYSLPHLDHSRPGTTAVQALHSSSSSNLLVSASTTRLRPPNPHELVLDDNDSLAHNLMKRSAPKKHEIAIHSIVSPWQPPEIIPLVSKPWSIQLEPSRTNNPSWLAIGQSGTSPLTVLQLDSTGVPLLSTSTNLANTLKPTSVYSLTTPSIDCSPFLRPDQTLIAAFFDSTTRIYDLRLPTTTRTSSFCSALIQTNEIETSPSSSDSNEVLRLSDPWSDDPSYSVSSGGPLGNYIAVGSARNSAIRIFDIRSVSVSVGSSVGSVGVGGSSKSKGRSTGGITAFGPKGDRSPIYGLNLENSRVWAVTETSGFVLNFHADDDEDHTKEEEKEESIAFVGHDGQGKGELRRTSKGR